MLALLFFIILDAQALEVGQSQFVQAKPDANIKISPSQLVEIQEEPEGVRLKAKAPGLLKVKIDGESRNIRILPAGTNSFHKKLKALTKNMLGPKVEFKNGQSHITGKLHRVSDWQKIYEFAAANDRPIQFRAQVDNDLHPSFRDKVKSYLEQHGINSFHLKFEPHPHIYLPEKSITPRLEKSLNQMGLSYVKSQEQIAMKDLIDIRIVVAELTKSFQTDLGIQWPTEFSAKLTPKFTGHNDLVATLRMAESSGNGQILASPHVVARSGGEAQFLAGGELPIRVVGRYTKGIQWKRHGIFLKIKPISDFDQNISLDLEAEVSMPDSGYSVDNIPAMKTNRVSSQFDLKAQSTIVLSGLIQNLSSLSKQSVAGLASLPIIGKFFTSSTRRNNSTELIIFVTPEVRSE